MTDEAIQTSKFRSFVVIITISALVALVVSILSAYAVIVLSDRLTRFSTGAPTLSDSEVQSRIVELIEEESATIAVVERVTPAVVSIVIKKQRGLLTPEDLSYDPYDFFAFPDEPFSTEASAELVEIGGGTGFFVSEDGLIATNRHVVSDSDASYRVVTNDGRELDATVVALDPFQDVAILLVEGDSFPTITFGVDERVMIGQTVIAIGNSLSEFRNTVTKGVVSGLNRRIVASDQGAKGEVIERAIQTDAAINPGNSGGPLINLLGEVIAMNTAVSFEGESLGFAIPIGEVKRAVEDVKEFGRIVRPWLGVRYIVLTPEIAKEHQLTQETGALIASSDREDEPAVYAGSPAALAGFQEGDVIISVDEVAITETVSLSSIVSRRRPGDTLTFTILRNGQSLFLPVTLAEYEPN